MKRQRHKGAGNLPASRDIISETAAGIPDDAAGPGQLTAPELMDLAAGKDAAEMTAKLKAEADARSKASSQRPPRRKPDGGWDG
jgi:hypothetical protein